MSAEIRRLFPEGLKDAEAERGKPRHVPPLRFVPSKSLDTEDGEDDYNKSITVELTNKTTMKVVPYTFLDVESFLGYQKQFQYILSQQEAELNYDKYKKICNDTKTKLSTISENSIVQEEKLARRSISKRETR